MTAHKVDPETRGSMMPVAVAVLTILAGAVGCIAGALLARLWGG